MIYFDNNATTPVLPEVREAMLPFLGPECGNPNSVHQRGTRARASIEKVRGSVARILGVVPSEIIFTGSGSEANNHAVLGVLLGGVNRKGNLVISSMEHASVREAAQWAAERFGFELRVASFVITNGAMDPQPFIELMDEDTRLVSVMFANNEIGVVLPVREIFEAAHRFGAICHTDAVQGVGKLPLKPRECGADLLSFSAHKFHGPKGVGCLFLRRGLKIEPLIHGGPQENGRRAGTENVANIAGLGKALERALESGTEMVCDVRDYWETCLRETFSDRFKINFGQLARTPNVSSVCFKGQDANLILIKLDRAGFCVSTGAACNSGSLSASATLLGVGLSEADANATIRFSFSKLNTRAEVDALLEALAKILPRK